jgi:hypothetical protein
MHSGVAPLGLDHLDFQKGIQTLMDAPRKLRAVKLSHVPRSQLIKFGNRSRSAIERENSCRTNGVGVAENVCITAISSDMTNFWVSKQGTSGPNEGLYVFAAGQSSSDSLGPGAVTLTYSQSDGKTWP